MSEPYGRCAQCEGWHYLFAPAPSAPFQRGPGEAGGLCMLCEDRRLVAAYQETRSEEAGAALDSFRDYVENTIR